ncbi:hypothetical protein PIB30_018903 [Stylosanthes scabra]|uniref:Uncharacterized protein n=1 Tax=Stylosanthes scabra TaxID=79078 RepID=A0ABU6W6Q0_9FABA|nr:hypothetical protein [Stylosanthes scabra]
MRTKIHEHECQTAVRRTREADGDERIDTEAAAQAQKRADINTGDLWLVAIAAEMKGRPPATEGDDEEGDDGFRRYDRSGRTPGWAAMARWSEVREQNGRDSMLLNATTAAAQRRPFPNQIIHHIGPVMGYLFANGLGGPIYRIKRNEYDREIRGIPSVIVKAEVK